MSRPRWALWQERVLRLGLAGAPSVLGAVGGVLRQKWLALHLETAGLGVIGQVTSAQAWLGTLTALGLGTPLARSVGASSARGDDAAVRRAVSTAVLILAAALLPVVLLGLALAPWISLALLGTTAYATLVRIAMVGVAGLALQGTLLGLFAGRSDVRAPFVYALAGNVAAVALVFLLVPRFGLQGALWGLVAYWPAAIVSALALRRADYRSAFAPAPRPRFDRVEGAALLRVAAAALTLALVDQGTLLALRAHHVRANGIAANGLFQAAIALAQMCGAVFYSYLGNYAFGRISGAGGPEGIRAYTRRQWTPLLALAALAFALLIAVAGPLLHLLFSSRFDAARPMLGWMAVGEFARVAVQAWALGALPLGGVRLWMPIGLAAGAGTAAAYVVATAAGLGTLALPCAYAAGGLAALAVTAGAMGRRGVLPTARGGGLLALALLALVALAVLVTR